MRQAADTAPEVIYETDRTRVVQLTAPDGVTILVRKEQLGPRGLDRTRHELRILRRLFGVPGVVQLVDPTADAIVMADVPGPSVAQVISWGGFESLRCIVFAQELAGIVAAVHRRGVMHCDISPANIFLAGEPDDADDDDADTLAAHPTLIDFHLASTFVEQFPGFSHPRDILGTPPYLAPEQTGRTGIPVDHRADLYGIGATLYALSTGEPPFRPADLLTTIHDILTEVPTPPAERNPRIPRQFSDIIMRLLEKEPDRRYQSAEGLAYDLSRLHADLVAGRADGFALGERDFPRRLAVPSRLIGRDTEIAELRSALDAARSGGGRTVLITGVAGVGKTALVNTLRPVVTESRGRLISGKFDQYRPDAGEGAITHALRELGRLLLAGDEVELARVRGRLIDALGADVGLLAALPEFATLTRTDPVTVHSPVSGDPRDAESRQLNLVLTVLKTVVSAQRPVVMAIDDLQWAGAPAIAVIDAIVTAEHLTGVLLVGSYRDSEIDEAHPLSVALARWSRLGVAPSTMRLGNLAPDDLSTLLGEMLRLPVSEARELATAVGSTTGGNPFDTMELVNALRHDGALVQGASGWHWDAATIRRFVGRGDVLDLLAARIERLPAASRELLEIMSCVGNEVPLDLLSAAGDRPPSGIDEHLIAALEDGLLVRTVDGPPLVRFRHDRVQQAARARLDGGADTEVQLSIARRLARHPEFSAVAAEQYLPCAEALRDAAEIRTAAELFVVAAATARLVNPAAAHRFLTAAIGMLGPAETTAGEVDPLLVAAWRQQHAVLSVLGRLAEGDEVYAALEQLDSDPVDVAGPACVQIAGLTGRARPQEAIALGLVLLARLGVGADQDDYAGAVARGYPDLIRWATTSSAAADLARPEIDSPVVEATSRLIYSMITPSHVIDPAIADWLIITAHRLWTRHGPNAPLAATLSTAIGTLSMRGDFDAGYAVAVHVRTIGEARGYEPETSYIRHILSIGSMHYYERLEECVRQAHLSREGLIRGGDLQLACWTYFSAPAALLECAPTMDIFAADIESGLVFAARTGSDHGTATCLAFRQLARALRGETEGPGSFDDAAFTEAGHLAAVSANPLATAYFHVYRALSAALFGDVPALIRNTAPAMALCRYFVGLYPTVLAHLLHGLALGERIREAAPDERAALLDELDRARDWLAARAAGRPGNFGHLVTLLDAERAWAVGDRWGAAEAFDAARHQVRTRNRPWHRALIAERAARFHLGHQLAQTGRDLLVEARRQYVSWSATGKVAQLDRDHPYLRAAAVGPTGTGHPTTMSGMSVNLSGQALDMLAVLRSSQALSSETTPEGLRTRLGEVLRAMTGATTVLIVLRDDESGEWQLWDTTGGTADGVPLADAAALLPLPAFRYVERSGEPLLVGDPHTDERFAHDPHLSGVPRCSLLVMPLFDKGALRGVLILENTRRTGAFAADGLEAVLLVAGQLTVSLDNTQLYASLERKVRDRTAALERANSTLEALSTTDALTDLPNRRHFDDVLRAEWQRATTQHTALGLAMIDVDTFKPYNDHYGHPAGDECLRRVAKTLGATLRDGSDIACRYGGEEFAIILPNADEAGCILVAERIRAAVQDLDLPHHASPIGRVTISVGVASYRPQLDEMDAADQLVAIADRALYAAKRGGRNRVCSTHTT